MQCNTGPTTTAGAVAKIRLTRRCNKVLNLTLFSAPFDSVPHTLMQPEQTDLGHYFCKRNT